MNMIVTTPEAQKGFYPTPPALAAKLVKGLKLNPNMSILEPSAGTGNLIFALAPMIYSYYYSGRCYGMNVNVDCCEIDPALRGYLKENFSSEAKQKCKESKEAVLKAEGCTEFGNHRNMSDAGREVYEQLKEMECLYEHAKVRVVHDDFLSYNTENHYDAIIMNPPFANGDLHLLKAIQMQKRYGGQIHCILNAETIRNPYSKQRMLLAQWLQEYDADIEFVEGAFLDAERKTDVDVAVIKLTIPRPELFGESEFWNRCEKAQQQAEPTAEMPTDLVLPDIVKQFVSRYNVEVNAGCQLIREYIALAPYIMRSATKNEYDKPILLMGVGSASADEKPSINEYIRHVRKKYWALLFQRKEFVGQLTGNLQDLLTSRVNEMVEYEFSEFNIRQIMAEMHAAMQQGVIDTILELFETMTVKHTYSTEFGQNIHLFNGWKTNKAWKVGKKVIIPFYCNIFREEYSFSKGKFVQTNEIHAYNAHRFLADIEKSLNYLDGHMTEEVRLAYCLESAAACEKTKNIQCKFFDVTFYKKGTCHITFTCPDLIDRLNIFCARQRNWLPPRYGKAAYGSMDAEEKAVVDSFHGDGSEGSGEKVYADVMARASYFLAPPNNDTPMLDCGSEEE